MKPVLLKIKGLNSFEEEQIIDFDKLTSKGLFGIFGTTGSGKTSIIDAMTLALYGEISRYEGDSKNKKFININTENSKVSLEFLINGEERYVAERGYKKQDTVQKITLARLYKKTNDVEEVIADKATQVTSAVEDIIGLTYKDFIKTVILPQGKFSEFLLLANAERRNMLERVFHLEEYGERLLVAIKGESNIKAQELQVLDTKLGMYGDVTMNMIEEKEAEKNLLSTELESLKVTQKEVVEENNNLRNIQKLCRSLRNYEEKLVTISNKDEEIEKDKLFLTKTKQTRLIIPSYHEMKETKKDYEENNKNLDINDGVCNRLALDEKEIQSKLNSVIELKNIEVPRINDKISVLKQARGLYNNKNKLLVERNELLKGYQELKLQSDDSKKKIEKFEKSKRALQEEMNRISERKKVIHSILDVRKDIEEAYYFQIKVDEQKIKLHEISEKHKTYTKQISNYNKKLKSIEEKFYLYEEETANIYNATEEKYKILKNDITEAENSLNEKEKELLSLQDLIKDIEKNNLILKISEGIKDGEACPICGNLEYDMPKHKIFSDNINTLLVDEKNLKANIEDNKNLLAQNNVMLLNLEILIDEFKNHKKEVISATVMEIEDPLKLRNMFKEIENKIASLNTEREVLLANIEKDQRVLGDTEAEMEKIKEEINANSDHLKDFEGRDIKKLNENIKLCDKEVALIAKKEELNGKNKEDINTEIEKLNNTYQDIKIKINEIKAVGAERKKRIDELESEILKLSEGKNIEESLQDLENKKNALDLEEEQAREACENISKGLNKNLEAKAGFEEKKNTLNSILLKQEENIKALMKKYSFESIEEVLKYDITEREEALKESMIKRFNDEKSEVNNNIARLQRELENVDTADIDERFNLSVEQKNMIEDKILESTQHVAVMEQHINKMKLDFEAVSELAGERKALNDYVDILIDLSKVLEGKRFVEFVAKKQLKYIVADASVRLKDMSHGRYAIELDDTDFVIRDDHFGGLRRSPRTLSGGETFMASLCLALALSSKIQLKNKSTLELFFLDEGFGTLDLGSLDVVMNSLIKLQSQKMSVGVISHVEEMKSSIPMKLEVTPASQGLHGTLVRLE